MRFADRTVLRDVSCDIRQGTVWVIVGPNGAGKTTLLRLMAGALKPTSGAIAWAGADQRTRSALVAQRVALYPYLTLRENCLASGRMEGLRGRALAERTQDALEQTLCTDVEGQLVGRLSGGYQRRAAIAAATMGDARLLILDEPSTGLDVEATQAIVAVVRRLRDDGRTIVLTTHDFGLADALADTVMLLRDGRLLAHGAPLQLCAAFARGAKYVDFTLRAEPSRRDASILAGLSAARLEGRRYGVFSDTDGHGGLSVLRRLHEAGIVFRELRVREPGTAMLFERYCLSGAPH